MAKTALQAAMDKGAKNVPKGNQEKALDQAVSKIAGLTKKAAKSKDAVVQSGAMVVHTAETQGSLFLASMAEGFLGEQKMKLGPVDMRIPVALLGQGYGLYEAMTAGGRVAGGHALALGNGVMGSWLASVAVKAGRTLREKKESAATTQGVEPEPVVPAVQGGDTLLSGPAPKREVLLTPEPLSTEGDDYGDDDYDDYGDDVGRRPPRRRPRLRGVVRKGRSRGGRTRRAHPRGRRKLRASVHD